MNRGAARAEKSLSSWIKIKERFLISFGTTAKRLFPQPENRAFPKTAYSRSARFGLAATGALAFSGLRRGKSSVDFGFRLDLSILDTA